MLAKLSNFQQRFFLGLLGILVIAAIIFFSHTEAGRLLFASSVCAIQAVALHEFYGLARQKKMSPHVVLAVTLSILYTFFHFLFPQSDFLALFLCGFVIISSCRQFYSHQDALANVSVTLSGFLYVTIPLSFLLDINFPKAMHSPFWIVYLIFCTKMTDTAAYFAGKGLGSKCIAPILSPKKTVEGAIGGLLGAALTSIAFIFFAPKFGVKMDLSFSLFEAGLLGLVIGFLAQIGDLAESLFKRDANVKDSNNLPGFGGVLDIVDSLIFTTPLLFFWLKMKNLI